MSDPIFKIAPSILSADFARLGEHVKEAELAGADLLHVDIMDGHFVPNLTIGPVVVDKIRPHTKLPLDVHLMIDRPDIYAGKFLDAGADYISFHIEVKPDVLKLVKQIQGRGAKAGLVVNPDTAVKEIEPYLPYIDFVLVMSVYPGFAGQKFIDDVLIKIREIKKIIENKKINVEIEIDGGIAADNINKAKEAGANIFVAGSSVFNGEGIKENIDRLRLSLS